MKAYLITFRSITLAQRAEAVLGRNNIQCHVRRTPRWMEDRGCGYAGEARLGDIEQGTAILRRQGIPYRKTYRMNQDGEVEEPGNDLS